MPLSGGPGAMKLSPAGGGGRRSCRPAPLATSANPDRLVFIERRAWQKNAIFFQNGLLLTTSVIKIILTTDVIKMAGGGR
jgi:hypothetical protein